MCLRARKLNALALSLGGLLGVYFPVRMPPARGLYAIIAILFFRQYGIVSFSALLDRILYSISFATISIDFRFSSAFLSSHTLKLLTPM